MYPLQVVATNVIPSIIKGIVQHSFFPTLIIVCTVMGNIPFLTVPGRILIQIGLGGYHRGFNKVSLCLDSGQEYQLVVLQLASAQEIFKMHSVIDQAQLDMDNFNKLSLSFLFGYLSIHCQLFFAIFVQCSQFISGGLLIESLDSESNLLKKLWDKGWTPIKMDQDTYKC